MTCTKRRPKFAKPSQQGLGIAKPLNDGYSVELAWDYAYPDPLTYTVGYNVYYSTFKSDVFSEGAKIFTPETTIIIGGFSPGDTYYFAIRATEYEASVQNPLQLPESLNAEDGYTFTETILSEAISDVDLLIPTVDAYGFPSTGVIQVGGELIRYYSVDYDTGIFYATPDGRGYYDTFARLHDVDGYDGSLYRDPIIKYFKGFEETNDAIVNCQVAFSPPYFPFNELDGYKQVVKDSITTDLSGSDEENISFPYYPFTGYRRDSPTDILSGKCIGSYMGGESWCADGYTGTTVKVRGLNIQTENLQREELLLNLTGEPCILIKRMWTGIRCNCFRGSNSSTQGRCPICFGVGFVGGYEQYFSPRRSDGKILVRFTPANDDLDYKPQGFENNYKPNCRMLAVPTIKDRDILIRFDQFGNEEFRYEILNVNRNKLLFSNTGAQNFQISRLDKTDLIYQWRVIRDTSMYPRVLNTTIATLRTHGPHMHTVVVDEHIAQISQINQTTSIIFGHSHPIINGVVQAVLGHTHEILALQ